MDYKTEDEKQRTSNNGQKTVDTYQSTYQVLYFFYASLHAAREVQLSSGKLGNHGSSHQSLFFRCLPLTVVTLLPI